MRLIVSHTPGGVYPRWYIPRVVWWRYTLGGTYPGWYQTDMYPGRYTQGGIYSLVHPERYTLGGIYASLYTMVGIPLLYVHHPVHPWVYPHPPATPAVHAASYDATPGAGRRGPGLSSKIS